jgi:hypothetical protein
MSGICSIHQGHQQGCHLCEALVSPEMLEEALVAFYAPATWPDDVSQSGLFTDDAEDGIRECMRRAIEAALTARNRENPSGVGCTAPQRIPNVGKDIASDG